MDSVSYQVVFDIGHRGPQYWWLLIIPVVMVTAGITMLRAKPFQGSRAFLIVFTGVAGAVALAVATSMVREYSMLRTALAQGHYRTVEGLVTDFVPASGGDHHAEHFIVVTPTARVPYSYSWATVTQGFNESQNHGGPMHEGLRVRIADVNGEIARLEIAP
jgi:hypothetical protein